MKYKFRYAVLSALLFAACSEKNQGGASVTTITEDTAKKVLSFVELTDFQYKNAGIELGSIEGRGISETINTTGEIDIPPQNYAQVSTYIGAIVKSIQAIEGDFVRKGQTVMILEHPDFIKLQEDYIAAKSNLDFSEKEYRRQKDLYEEKISSGKIYQDAESRYNAERARVSSLRKQLEMLSLSPGGLDKGNITRSIPLKAPVSGFVGHINTSIGAYAEPNKVIFDVVNLNDVHIHLKIFEKDIAKVKIGQTVHATIPNQPERKIEAVIFRIGKTLDKDTKAMDVHADIRGAKEGLLPGLFVNAVVNISDKHTTAVPDGAIVRAGSKQYIFLTTDDVCASPKANGKQSKVNTGKASADSCGVRMVDGKMVANAFKMVEVKTGASGIGYTEISPAETITGREIIAVKGAYYLMSQLKSSEMQGCCDAEKPEKK